MTSRPRPGRVAVPDEPPSGRQVAIVVVNWNGRPFLQRALESIVAYTDDHPHELIVVDNGSEDDSGAYLDGFRAPAARRLQILRNPTNRYFSAAFNQGFNAASPESRYLMVFCNDVEAKESGWLGDFVTAIEATGAVAAGHAVRQALDPAHRQLLRENLPAYPDAALERQIVAAAEDADTRYWHLSGYCFLLDRALLGRIGGYVEGGPFRQYHSDWELYLRFHASGLVVAPIAHRLHHWHGISELIAEYPDRYRELLSLLADDRARGRYLRQGRPLFPEESAYASWLAQQRDGSE